MKKKILFFSALFVGALIAAPNAAQAYELMNLARQSLFTSMAIICLAMLILSCKTIEY